MKNNNKSVIVPMIIASTLGWSFFVTEAIKQSSKEQLENTNKYKYSIEDIKDMSVSEQVKESHQDFYDEYERLKEEECKRLEELERQRLLKIEQERLAELARVEAEKKKQLEIEEAKKKALTNKNEIVYNDNSRGWMTIEASYYTSSCYKCSGVTKSGYNVRNTIYYKDMRIIATDPKRVPLGSIVEVKTHYGSFKAVSLDTGGRIINEHVDILVGSKDEAYKLGRHDAQLRIIGKINLK